jgi:hypothetical protein
VAEHAKKIQDAKHLNIKQILTDYDTKIAYAFGSTFAFFQQHKAKQKCKRATKPTHQDSHEMTTKTRQKRRAKC